MGIEHRIPENWRRGSIVSLILNLEQGEWAFAKMKDGDVLPIVEAHHDETDQSLTLRFNDGSTITLKDSETLYRPDRRKSTTKMEAFQTHTIVVIPKGFLLPIPQQTPLRPIGCFYHVKRREEPATKQRA